MGPIPGGRALACLRPGHARTAALASAAALTLAATAATAAVPTQAQAQAADACANADVRAQQQGGNLLPDCRAYEKVTPDRKAGLAPQENMYAGRSGNAVAWDVFAPLEDQPAGIPGQYRSYRTADGWRQQSLLLPMTTTYRLPVVSDLQNTNVVDPETGRRVLTTNFPLVPGDRGTQGTRYFQNNDVYRREIDGSTTWITAPPSGETALNDGSLTYFWQANPDLSRVLVHTPRRLTDVATPTTGGNHAYVYVDGLGPQLVTVAVGAPGSLTPAVRPNISASNGDLWGTEDLDTVAFMTGNSSTGQRLFVRRHVGTPAAAVTVEAAVAPDGTPCTGSLMYMGLSPDGTKAAFSCQGTLGTSAPAGPVNTFVRDLTLAPSDTDAITYVATFPQAEEFATAGFGLAVASDGTSFYDGATGTTRQLGTGGVKRSIRFTPDSRYLVAELAGVPGKSTGGFAQVIRVDLQEPDPAKATVCVSCPIGEPATAASSLGGYNPTNPSARSGGGQGVITDDGRQVVFETTQALVGRDTNGKTDVYAWKDGEHRLLSSGSSPQPSTLVGSSGDGRTVFFTTVDSLVPQDTDRGEIDIYAARVGGGFLAPPPPPAECTTDCQPPAALPAPSIPSPTAVLRRDENETEGRAVAVRLTLSGATTVRGTSGVVKAKVNGPGVLSVSGSGVQQASRAARKAGTYSLTVRLSAAAQRTLRRTGKASVKVSVRFESLSGTTKARVRTLAFRPATKKAKTAKTATTAKKGER